MDPPPPAMPPAKPRLLVVAATYATAETRKKIDALAEHFEVVCVTCRSYTGYGLVNRLADQPAPTAYRLVGLPSLGRPQSTTRYLLPGLAGVLRRFPADVVLVESEPWAWIRWQTWLAWRRHGRGALFGEFLWDNAVRHGLKGRILQLIYRVSVHTADFVIAGNAEAGGLLRAAGLPTARLLVAPQLGVDPEVFRPAADDDGEKRAARAARGLPAGAFVVGFSGRLAEEKGVADLLAAIKRIRAEGATDVHLALLGHGPLSEGLRAQAASQGASPWLHVFGSCTHPEMADFMRTLDVFVLASRELDEAGRRWKEQFGHVLIEAMACGVATVGSTSGAIPEVLAGGGQTFPEGDVPALAAALGELRADPAARAVLAAAGRARVLGHYTHSALARTWANFLYELPGAAGSGATTRT